MRVGLKAPCSLFSLLSAFIICTLFSVCCNRASEIPRPRGVSISKAGLYVPSEDFTCFDGSNVIPFNQINDDYCDCIDGSDEPGTAACPASFFHCTNAGYRPANIPSSQVNDGICDCCDGTDEYASQRHCENTCMDMGKAERILAQKRAEIARAGNQARLQASAAGKQLKQEKREKSQQLQKDKEEADKIQEEKERLKSDAEALEKVALEAFNELQELNKGAAEIEEEEEARSMFTLLDTNQDNELDLSELVARQTFDQNKDGVVSNEEAAFFLDNADKITQEEFFESGWNRMKPFVMRERGLFTPPSNEEGNDEKTEAKDDDELFPGVGTVEDVTGEYHQQRKGDEDGELQGDEEAEEEEEEEEEEEQEEETPAPPPEVSASLRYEYDEETQKLVNAASAARSEAEEADRTVRDIQRELTQLQEYLEKDFGPEEEFAPLEGQCYEYTDREYTYKHCPFDQASQRPKSGGSETRLGVWKSWAGPADDKYSVMAYDKGQSCWNGPQRSTTVRVTCGIENELVGVSEPNKCEYQFEFTSPSACRAPDGQANPPHDEL